VLRLARAKKAKMPGIAHTKASEKAAASYPIILRSYEPVADLDETAPHLRGP
jgi:hypothetical protein